MLQTMNELYKVARMGGTYLPAQRMFYLATLGGAAPAAGGDHRQLHAGLRCRLHRP
jgi:cytosine/adenosine deaminase-related metal-dependent hydrolase